MTVFANIVFIICIFVLGGTVGALIAVKYLDKSVTDMVQSYNRIIECYKNIICLDKRFMQSVYADLVKLREIGTDNLDELIGYLGEYLDDNEGEDSDEPDSDRETTVQEG